MVAYKMLPAFRHLLFSSRMSAIRFVLAAAFLLASCDGERAAVLPQEYPVAWSSVTIERLSTDRVIAAWESFRDPPQAAAFPPEAGYVALAFLLVRDGRLVDAPQEVLYGDPLLLVFSESEVAVVVPMGFVSAPELVAQWLDVERDRISPREVAVTQAGGEGQRLRSVVGAVAPGREVAFLAWGLTQTKGWSSSRRVAFATLSRESGWGGLRQISTGSETTVISDWRVAFVDENVAILAWNEAEVLGQDPALGSLTQFGRAWAYALLYDTSTEANVVHVSLAEFDDVGFPSIDILRAADEAQSSALLRVRAREHCFLSRIQADGAVSTFAGEAAWLCKNHPVWLARWNRFLVTRTERQGFGDPILKATLLDEFGVPVCEELELKDVGLGSFVVPVDLDANRLLLFVGSPRVLAWRGESEDEVATTVPQIWVKALERSDFG